MGAGPGRRPGARAGRRPPDGGSARGAATRPAVDLLALEPDNATLAGRSRPSSRRWSRRTSRSPRSGAPARRRRCTGPRRSTGRCASRTSGSGAPGASDRVIEPYRLVRTRRGWEVDAGPPDDVAAVRTYLVSGIVDHELLDATFAPPDDLDALARAEPGGPPGRPGRPAGVALGGRAVRRVGDGARRRRGVGVAAGRPAAAGRASGSGCCCLLRPGGVRDGAAALVDAGEATARLLLEHHTH